MHINATITAVAAAAAAVAPAGLTRPQMQLHFYKDRCITEIKEVNVYSATRAGGDKTNCHNIKYSSTIRMTGCSRPSCQCVFFSHANCQGIVLIVNKNSTGCINTKYTLNSFACYH